MLFQCNYNLRDTRLDCEKQPDGSWLIWDRKLVLAKAEEAERIANLPRWKYSGRTEQHMIGKYVVTGEQEEEIEFTEEMTIPKATKWLCDLVGFEWNASLTSEREDFEDGGHLFFFRTAEDGRQFVRGRYYQTQEGQQRDKEERRQNAIKEEIA